MKWKVLVVVVTVGPCWQTGCCPQALTYFHPSLPSVWAANNDLSVANNDLSVSTVCTKPASFRRECVKVHRAVFHGWVTQLSNSAADFLSSICTDTLKGVC